MLRFRTAWGQLRGTPGRLVTTVLAVASGVALASSVLLANHAVVLAMEEGAQAVTGRADLEVAAASRSAFDEHLVDRIKAVPGVTAAAPVITQTAFTDDEHGELLTVYGIDLLNEEAGRLYRLDDAGGLQMDDALVFLSQPDSVIAARQVLSRRGLSGGATLGLLTPTGPHTVTVRGVMEPRGGAATFGGSLLVMDVYSAQPLFALEGRVTQVDVVVAPDVDATAVGAEIERVLPEGLRVAPAGKRRQEVRALLAGFQLMLDAFAAIALLVSGLITFNRLSTVFRARLWEIGVTRALGASRPTVVRELLKESALLGVTGVALGLPAGVVLAQRVMPPIADTMAIAFSAPVGAASIPVRALPLAVAAVLGLGTTLAAALVPAWRAASMPVADVLRARGLLSVGTTTGRSRLGLRLGLAAVAAGLVAAGAWTRWTQLSVLAMPAILVAACAGIGPALTGLQGPLAGIAARLFGTTGRLAIADLMRLPERTVTTVSVLSVGLCLVVWFDMVGYSFQTSVTETLGRSRQADLIVSSDLYEGNDVRGFSDEALAAIAAIPGVQAVSGERGHMNGPHGLMAFDPIHFRNPGFGTWRLEGHAIPDALDAVADGRAVLASPAFVRSRGLHAGDAITLDTPAGPYTTVLAGITVASFYSMNGDLVLSRELLRTRWGDGLLARAHVLVAPGADRAAVRAALADTVGRQYRLRVFSAREIAESFAALVRRGMTMTYGIQGMTLLVVLLGAGDALMASVLDRTREIGTMRAIGAPRRRIAGMLAIQAVTMGVLGALFAWVAGMLLAVVWLRLAMPSVLGWSQDFHLRPASALATLVLAAVTCLLAAVLPARRAVRLSPADALRYE